MQLMRLILCMQVRDKMETAKRDTIDRVDKYTKKYKPTADKYNKLCVSALALLMLHPNLHKLPATANQRISEQHIMPSEQHTVTGTVVSDSQSSTGHQGVLSICQRLQDAVLDPDHCPSPSFLLVSVSQSSVTVELIFRPSSAGEWTRCGRSMRCAWRSCWPPLLPC